MKALFLAITVAALVVLGSLVALGLESPLQVDGNAALEALPGISGSGTEADPFILEGIQATDMGSLPFLALRNISAHTIIRDCTFSGASSAALDLQGCSNVWILSCVFSDNAVAVSTSSDCSGIVIALCTFERNERDVSGTALSVTLDDGYVGNWWDGNAALDLNGDGLSEIPYLVCSGERPLVDRHALAFPYAGDRVGDPEGVRLEIRHSRGDVYRLTSTSEMVMTIEASGTTSRSVLTQDLGFLVEVLFAPGTGYAKLSTEVIDDSGDLRINGSPYDYEGTQGLIWEMGSHRFGGGSLDVVQLGNVEDGSSIGPIQSSYAFYPVRPISVGHSWTNVSPLAPSDFNLSQGSALLDTKYTLLRLEDLRGVPCAVIESVTEIAIDGDAISESVGTIKMIGIVGGAGTMWVSLSTGEMLRSINSTDSYFESFVDGELISIFEIELYMTIDLAEEP